MNCWIWIILLWCFCGNGGCNNCSRANSCDNDTPSCNSGFTTQVGSSRSQNNGCGCDNDMMQPRGFAGFGDTNTCGCEEKND